MGIKSITATIHNNVVSGLSGVDINNRFSLEQIEDDVIRERQAIIKEYSLKNLIPKRDLLMSINCLTVDCKAIEKCCLNLDDANYVRHIEIPQLVNDFGSEAIDFIGSVDRQVKFKVYTDYAWRNHKFKRRGAERPYVWIDTSPNENNMYDVFIFNAPLLKIASISAIFKDERQLEYFECCKSNENEGPTNFSFIDKDIIKRVTENYIRYYRQMATALLPNDQSVK